MNSKAGRFLSLCTAMLSLCACTRQESIDAYEFCRLHNRAYKEHAIPYESVFLEEGAQNRVAFLSLAGGPALLSLELDEHGTVTGLALTAESGSFSREGLSGFYEAYLRLSSVLLAQSLDETRQRTKKLKLLPESFAFKDACFEAEDERFRFCVCADGRILTAYSEIIDGKAE